MGTILKNDTIPPVAEIISTYLKGWELGDAELSLSVTAVDFYYDDPNTGRIQRHEFLDFVAEFKRIAAEMGNGQLATPFLEYTDIVIKEGQQLANKNSAATVWCWWRAKGTDLQGSALIKANEEGILCETIAYFSALPV